jgi:hypothetical protein
MKRRMGYVIALCCFTAIAALAQKAGLEGTWVTEGVPAVEAAIKAKQSVNGLAEGTRIKFKVDTKKNKVSGTIIQLNTDKEYDIVEGVLNDKAFTFKSVEIVPFGNNNRGFNNNSAPAPISWKGELTETDTVNLTRLSATGEPTGAAVVLRRGK